MSRRVRWIKELGILVVAIAATGLILTLLIRTVMGQPRPARERTTATEAGQLRRRREFRPPEPVRGLPLVLKQLAIVTVIAVVGRKVFRIRLGG